MIFSIENYNKDINNLILQIKNIKWYNFKICKTLIIVGLATFFQLSVSSCKTCKCPAYSQTTIQNSSNLNDLIT